MRYHPPAGEKGEEKVKRLLMCCLPGLAVLLLFSATPAFAGQSTSNFQVTASVAANCTISSTNIAFGVYDPVLTNSSTGVDVDAAGSVNIRCTKGTAPNIGLSLGSNAIGSIRRMVDGAGAEYLSYEIYSNAGRTVVWGNSAGSWVVHTPTGPPNTANYPTYGRITRGQDVAPGSYTDTVTATVNF